MRVLIAGGGTGGHLFPGIALAEEIVTRHPKNDVVFVGTDRGLEARVVPQNGFVFEAIKSRGLKGMGVVKMLLGLLLLPVSFFSAIGLLRKYKPDVVVGVGGYSSGPVVLMAWLLRIPTAIQEQNALPGFTNKVLGKFVDAIFVSFEAAIPFFPYKRAHALGNPIRRALLENFLRSTIAHERFTLLIFGGSLGARGINSRVIDALPFLKDLKGEIHVIHQTGKADLETVKKGYADQEFPADVREFIDDMAGAYLGADLVLCRAGATTLAELTVCKKASILVPFPHATDDHQAVNAKALVDAGAAIMFREADLTGEKLAAAIRELKNEPPRLAKMEKAAGMLGRPEASGEIAAVLQQLCLDKWGALTGQKRQGEPLRPKLPEKTP
ncbi:MAG: undecaprenyldiphospho-muramoylpentapeptide beta-N-acetylglucosaminyltransferase [Archangium sp.]|nr:undecaprenyldiphospho-muramoylpentapeptide beta-N-acetylglucosaminyltransferase [Archangium sp.]MDP3156312.1 undecaprenyldiphospho-muramoylpentapeptide beta-N-acetylglucosaminyltransferase [Archangium sp.]MDP3570356.1 undecaprenyldiphospho-muramoylpentapeptide beta-N-acetylglucosaminyltransferase [Archangium sp.]